MVINNNRFLSIKYSFRKYSIGIVSSIYIYMYIYIIHCLTKITFKLERCSVVYIYIIYIYIYIYIGSILIPKSSDIMTSSSLFSGPSAAAAGISLVSRWYLAGISTPRSSDTMPLDDIGLSSKTQNRAAPVRQGQKRRREGPSLSFIAFCFE